MKKAAEKRTQVKAWVALQDLIDAGFISPPVEIVGLYMGHDFRAVVLADGRVRFQGRIYAAQRRGQTPLSRLAGLAMNEVQRPPRGREIRAADGWLFWRFKDSETGRFRQLAELRDMYLSGRPDA